MSKQIPSIILIGRPAAGKSEVIDYLKNVPVNDRIERFHIGEFEEIDDFPYIWDWFETDMILSKHGKPRLFTDDKLYFKDEFLWNLCIEKINLDFDKKKRDIEGFTETTTSIVEFSRGGENGFSEAFSYLDEGILKCSGIVYIKVSYEESKRKNQRRSKKGLEDTVLFHSLPDEKMDYYYKVNDWDKIAPDMEGYIEIKGIKVPYAVFPNEPEKTDDPAKLGPALEDVFNRLWQKISEK